MRLFRALLATLGLLLLAAMPSATLAQSSPSAYTSATRYDEMGRVVGIIAPDPDGAGSLKFAAARTTYDLRGNPIKVETGELAAWQSHTVLPKNWTGFTVLTTAETTYDTLNRKTTERVKGSDGVTISLIQ